MHESLRVPNNLFILHQIINRTEFHCKADEIALPRSDKNIKVAAFTVSKKSINSTKYRKTPPRKYSTYRISNVVCKRAASSDMKKIVPKTERLPHPPPRKYSTFRVPNVVCSWVAPPDMEKMVPNTERLHPGSTVHTVFQT